MGQIISLPIGPYCCFSPLIFSLRASFSALAASMAPSWSERVVAGVVVVVGARVVATTQVGGVHESMLGSPSFLPNTLAIELN